ncbi:endoribonuclease SymE [Raoultella terrigena]|jgi:toxic protein SymE|uniref:endoribonuclease SymE n=1 Tax=Raoultella terrigena TaxID=577 RepID=UPI00349FB15B
MTEADCIADSFDAEAPVKNKRQLTVSYASRFPDYTRIPAIVMKGQWLEAAGFATGAKVEVRVMAGCIVLTAIEPEPELEEAMRNVEKLSARKQKQVREFIGVIAGKRDIKN